MEIRRQIWINLLLSVLPFCGKVAAQIPVRMEPHHKVVFENGYIRLIEGHISAHDTTLPHKHAAASVVVFLSKSRFGIQIVGQPAVVADVRPGDIKYVAYDEKPVTHEVWNEGTTMFHFMVIEMVKQHPGHDTCSTLYQPDVKWLWQEKLVRAYSLDINKDRTFHLPKTNCPFLLIDISGTITATAFRRTHTLQADHFIFFPPQRDIEINGNNKEDARCVLLELD